MLNDTPVLPPEPVHDLTQRALVVDPAHVTLVVRSQECKLLATPEGAENVQGSFEAILCHGVVVLLSPSAEIAVTETLDTAALVILFCIITLGNMDGKTNDVVVRDILERLR